MRQPRVRVDVRAVERWRSKAVRNGYYLIIISKVLIKVTLNKVIAGALYIVICV